jgi:uncharacterized protein YdhG (YjbR/CyaY superfamily)
MKAASTKFKTVDEYLSTFPPNTKAMLKDLRKAIKETAPGAEELISYNMPAFKLHGVLVYYAAYKEHIGFYPTASGIAAFKKDLTQYEVSKGTIRFPLDRPLPFDLIGKIVKFKVRENLEKVKAKAKK